MIYGSAWCAATLLWAERTGVNLWFRRDAGNSHGSARFADAKELANLESGDGLLIGRNPSTGKLLRYDGPAHLLTLAPTRAGKGVAPLPPIERQKALNPTSEPTLFLLDEFAALGRLESIERATGLMAGYGLQLWPILQDMSQLKDLYGARAGTFIANAGVQQVFGVNDFETAKWLSQMIGQETTGYRTQSFKPGDVPSTSHNVTGRDLMTPDEIMQLPPELQLLRVQGQPTAVAQKLRYYADNEFQGLFAPQNQ